MHDGVSADSGQKIAIHNLSKTYTRGDQTVRALSDVNLSFSEGTFVTLFGPSGCGKTTLLRILAGLETHDSGDVSLFGETPQQATRAKNIAWVPQSAALLPWLSIRANVKLSQMVNRAADHLAGVRKRLPEDADQVLADLGLADFADARPAQLSGGMRQRAAIARGFVQGAPLMLMDEPFSALDELTRDAVRLRLLDVWERKRKTVIFVTHSALEAVLLSDKVVVMTPRPGRVHAVVDIDLPRPRGRAVLDSPEFAAKVREVQHILRQGWEADE
ncbi:ABC transporter ATP-binding protein [Ketogulonicigenium vulgare]|uniref:ABC-type nitrate/sulfonate/bicarbonate transport system, ATPase component n=1 Tax=Ketogulonicigenium vulgare (strain WSH-001) TaxID=759362 RepID=F9Y6V6_KETVW|nr:ABC transporter ATP-binding protein [Ketogulonicigenium vulgare]ADO42787.1 ABC-type nitrate/sulfonate/bicarbonate transport system, ATPase component [Ketogulonicigenium vulgare Y25]AEM40973.1 ABC-type nitrate/sulfonate/bicarbonate transport system, ATPase component [Ketogulonicigenium vulgare WSH-001]ALJ81124.1 sulfonate ABC transporter ATP-binding protein [Ketogulonicigenium vulgare]ANW33874.1 sulfonate ABC transporter ATP-binding protein [Ketogulonicigenium vulgare]AOZ54699.1 nitrate/sulf